MHVASGLISVSLALKSLEDKNDQREMEDDRPGFEPRPTDS